MGSTQCDPQDLYPFAERLNWKVQPSLATASVLVERKFCARHPPRVRTLCLKQEKVASGLMM